MKMPHELIHSPYLGEAIISQNRIVEAAKAQLEDMNIDFQGFIGMGLSGSMVAPLLAYVLGKRFAIVRKEEGARSHSATTHGIESGLKAGDRWLFCDDFICSGQTRARVIERIRDHHVGEVTYVGDYLYGSGGFSTAYLDHQKDRLIGFGKYSVAEAQQLEFEGNIL